MPQLSVPICNKTLRLTSLFLLQADTRGRKIMKNLLIHAMFLPRQQATHTHIKFESHIPANFYKTVSSAPSPVLSVQAVLQLCNDLRGMLPRQALDLLGSVLGSWPRLHPQRRDRRSNVEIVPGGCTRHHQTAPNPEAIVTDSHASLPNVTVPFCHFSRDLHLSSKI